MTTDVLEAASNWHSIKADVAAYVAYCIARSQQATQEFYLFTIITTSDFSVRDLRSSFSLCPWAMTGTATGLASGAAILPATESTMLAPLSEDTRGVATSIRQMVCIMLCMLPPNCRVVGIVGGTSVISFFPSTLTAPVSWTPKMRQVAKVEPCP